MEVELQETFGPDESQWMGLYRDGLTPEEAAKVPPDPVHFGRDPVCRTIDCDPVTTIDPGKVTCAACFTSPERSATIREIAADGP